MCSERRAFTLVELLVVVAIISILAAFLLPTLQKALDKARSMTCMSNLKQNGIFLNSYANDFGDDFPAVISPSSRRWSQFLYESQYAPPPTIGASTVFVCPAHPPKTWNGNPSITYGIWKGKATHGVSPPDHATWAYYLKRSKMELNRVLLADSTSARENPSWPQAYNLETGNGTEQTAVSWKVIHIRHLGKANALFVDGRSSSISEAWIVKDARYYYSKR